MIQHAKERRFIHVRYLPDTSRWLAYLPDTPHVMEQDDVMVDAAFKLHLRLALTGGVRVRMESLPG